MSVETCSNLRLALMTTSESFDRVDLPVLLVDERCALRFALPVLGFLSSQNKKPPPKKIDGGLIA